MTDKSSTKPAEWNLYMIRCGDGSLYTGITTDVSRRFGEHENIDGKNKGAKALRGKKPLTLVYQIAVSNRSGALKLEHRIKQLNKKAKEELVCLNYDFAELEKWFVNS